MQEIDFQNIPDQYEASKDHIYVSAITNLYHNFKFLYLQVDSFHQIPQYQVSVIDFLFDYLKKYKFIVYHFFNSHNSNQVLQIKQLFHKINIIRDNSKPQANCIICVEGKCLIIEQINYLLINEIFTKLIEMKIAVLNVTNSEINNGTGEEIKAKQEIESFLSNFIDIINKNYFVAITIQSIVGYLIRRNFYPTEYFEDKSFFNFDKLQRDKEVNVRLKLSNLIFSFDNKTKLKQQDLKEIVQQININKLYDTKYPIYEFNEKEFISLRKISINEKAKFNLAIHLETLHIFLLKILHHPDDGTENKHEIEFCKKYSHRCMSRFYGFMKEKTKIIGFVYEYMSNGDLVSFINKEHYNEMFTLLAINRVFEGINYLHSNHLIHRDLKPSNILIDHDYIPYISDYETILQYDEKMSSKSNFTFDFASVFYASPEQDQGREITYSTDIYSFGLIIYFLFEKKDMIKYNKIIYDKKENDLIPSMMNGSKNIQNLYENCIRFKPEERPKNNEIKKILIDEINSFCYVENCLLNSENNKVSINNYFFESIFLMIGNMNELKKCFKNIYFFKTLYTCKIKESTSSFFIKFGDMYRKGFNCEQNYAKAKELYDMAAKENDPIALVKLGNCYIKGYGVVKDYSKAKEYYEFAAKQNDLKGFEKLGFIYREGLGVKKDFEKAKQYYEMAAKGNNPDAFIGLGNLYASGQCVEQNYTKAKEYYELAAKQNKSQAFNNLGNLYKNGYGVKKDYSKAKEYYELAAKLFNANAYNNLGDLYCDEDFDEKDYAKAKEYYESSIKLDKDSNSNKKLAELYFNGLGVEVNYSKAIEYYELASQNNDPEAYYKLGVIYSEGIGVDINIEKSLNYLELAAQQNYIQALLYLGFLYYKGNNVEKDYKKTKYYYERAAEPNSSEALLNLGVLYENGYGVDQDYSMAKNYYELSAKQNNSIALLNLGNLYFYGNGVKQNFTIAKYYYELSANNNNPDALLNLGFLYETGQGAKQNYLIAKTYYELAIAHGNYDACYYLAELYFEGYGVIQNYDLARKLYELASQCNNSNALLKLGNIYANGLGVKQDFTKAKEYYELASSLNNSSAILRVGLLYFYGYGVPRDYYKAKECFELSASMDNSQAYFNLGILYEYGYGVEKDYSQAKEYYELSAGLKNSHALLSLGVFYELGIGVKQDYIQAKKYFELSSYFNNPDAYLKLGLLYENGVGVNQDFHLALKNYEYASQLGNFDAYLYLGNFYSSGDCVHTNFSKAIQFYLKSFISKNMPISVFDYPRNSFSWTWLHHTYCYISSNNLGLIYLIVFQDIDKADQYIKEAAFAEYPFGQNNFGLMKQFYFNKDNDAEYMYQRSSKHNFALADYNLAFLYEKTNQSEKAIEYYIKASENEDEPLMFHNNKYYDKQLEISKIFIVCLSNLILVKYYLDMSELEDAKKYFNRAFSKILKDNENHILNYTFKFQLKNIDNSEYIFSYLMSFILNFPSFNFQNQKSLLQLFQNEPHRNLDGSNRYFLVKNKLDTTDIQDNILYDPNELFDFAIKNNKKIFVDGIHHIIITMKNILYTPPYSILFGRINIEKSKEKELKLININELFYEGFGFKLNLI